MPLKTNFNSNSSVHADILYHRGYVTKSNSDLIIRFNIIYEEYQSVLPRLANSIVK